MLAAALRALGVAVMGSMEKVAIAGVAEGAVFNELGLIGKSQAFTGGLAKTLARGKYTAVAARIAGLGRYATEEGSRAAETLTPSMMRSHLQMNIGTNVLGMVGLGAVANTVLGGRLPSLSNVAHTAGVGLMWSVFGPAVNVIDTGAMSSFGGTMAAGMLDAGSDTRTTIANEMRYMHPSTMVDPYAGNLRRQALGYMLQSRQNTRSFLGSEARTMHDQGGY